MTREHSGELDVWREQVFWIVRPYIRHTAGRLLSEVSSQLQQKKGTTVFDVCGSIVTKNPEERKQKELSIFKDKIKGAPQYLEQTVCDLLKAWIRHLVSCGCIYLKRSTEFTIKKLTTTTIHSFITTCIHEWFCDTVGHMSDISTLKITDQDFDGINKALFFRIVSSTNWHELRNDKGVSVFNQSDSAFSSEASSDEVSDGEQLYTSGSEYIDDEDEDFDDEDDEEEEEEEDEEEGEDFDDDDEQEEEDEEEEDDGEEASDNIVDENEEDEKEQDADNASHSSGQQIVGESEVIDLEKTTSRRSQRSKK